MSCDVGSRCGWDPELLWLWCSLAAIAQIRPLAWEPPYAAGVALKRQKKKKKKRRRKRKEKQKEPQKCLLLKNESKAMFWT